MAYPTRCFEPGAVYFVTNRCMQSRFLLRPDPEVNRIVGAVLARATNIFPVDLFAHTVLSNHVHLLVRMRDGACLSDFVAYIEANIARRVGKLRGWEGRFWYRRFSAEPVLDDAAFEDRLSYILQHAVKEFLVERASDWPGLTCVPELLHGVVRYFDFLDVAAYNEAVQLAKGTGKTVCESDFVSRYQLKIAVPPCWEAITPEQRRQRARDMVREAEELARAKRGDLPVLGLEAILAQDPLSAPEHSKKSPRPLCHASTAEARNAFRLARRAFLHAYKLASELFRKGVVDVQFPPHCFRPPAPWGWQLSSQAEVAAAAAAA